MNSIVLRVLAAVLAVGALLAAWFGYRIGSAPAESEAEPVAAAPAPALPTVLAVRAIAPGQVIGAEDVALGTVDDAARVGLTRVEAVVGRLAAAPLAAGEPVRTAHLAQQGAVTALLGAGERGVALKVDEVVAVGGFLRPGDRVDVLLYLRSDRETANQSSAQSVLENLRVLAVGELVPEPAAEAQAPDAADGLTRRASGGKDEARKKAGASRSVVLAVPAGEAPRLMLAASSGTLRLALRGAAESAAAAPAGARAAPLRLAELAGAAPASRAAPAPRAPVARAAQRRPEAGRQVTGHRGEQVEVVSVGAR